MPIYSSSSEPPTKTMGRRGYGWRHNAMWRFIEDRLITARRRPPAVRGDHGLQLQTFLNQLTDGVATIDETTRIITWNKAAERIFGFRAAHMVGQKLDAFINDCAPGSALSRQTTGLRQGGELVPVELTLAELNQGLPSFYAVVFRDLTVRHAVDRALFQAKLEVEEAKNVKSRFLANMSHEIKTPLGAILGFSELLFEPKQSSSERAKCIRAIKKNGNLLTNMIGDILEISRSTPGALELDKQAFSLLDFVTDMASLLELKAEAKGITLSIRFDGHLPKHIDTDAAKLKHILANVIDNAIKFTQRGEVEVTIRQTFCNDHGRQLAFIVRDTGPGISPTLAARLFHAFVQEDDTPMRPTSGAGLGLIKARRLARVLGGDVKLTNSALGEGSVFTITIDPGSLAESPERPALIVRGSLDAAPARLDGVKILVVDDSEDNQTLIKMFLTKAGSDVELAANGREGVDKATQGAFNLVVMDIQMPVMDGYAATAFLRTAGYSRPIIALTAHTLKEEKDRCLASGFDGYLGKPIDRLALLDMLQHHARSAAAK